jgi:hypothetical protein
MQALIKPSARNSVANVVVCGLHSQVLPVTPAIFDAGSVAWRWRLGSQRCGLGPVIASFSHDIGHLNMIIFCGPSQGKMSDFDLPLEARKIGGCHRPRPSDCKTAAKVLFVFPVFLDERPPRVVCIVCGFCVWSYFRGADETDPFFPLRACARNAGGLDFFFFCSVCVAGGLCLVLDLCAGRLIPWRFFNL